LRRHAAAALPAECCGALIGVSGASGASGAPGTGRTEIRTMIPVANAARRPDRYRIDAATVLRLERQAGRTGLHVVGFYHSHPRGTAVPSAADLELAFPGYLYLIIGIIGMHCGELRCWRLRDDRSGFHELELRHPIAGAA
jgi:proteasome lid subunit RPN8/RPN11